ncbi:MAG: sodium:solute symporter family protein [Bdellovibrionota bacterium]
MSVLNSSPLDAALIGIFLLFCLALGFGGKKKDRSLTEYVLAGRTLSLPSFALSLFSTWYGGILGVGEFVYGYGISSWVLQGIPYYFFAIAFAVLFSQNVRKSQVLSLPDLLEKNYGKHFSMWGSLLTFVLSSPAPYLLMMAVLIQYVFGWTFWMSMAVGALISTLYLFWKGFAADVLTDVVLGIFMLAAFLALALYLIFFQTPLQTVVHDLPPLHLEWDGGQSMQFVAVWFFIALWTLVDPSFYHRCLAAKDDRTARKGIFVSILLWFVFDMCTLTAGLYARVLLPHLEKPLFAFPELANSIVPPGWRALFYMGMFATIITSFTSFVFVSGVSLGKDMIARFLDEHRESHVRTWIQFSMGISLALGSILVLWFPSVVQLWYTIASVAVPGLLFPLCFGMIGIFCRRMWVFSSSVMGVVASCGWLAWGQAHLVEGYPSYPWGMEPMIPGLLISLLFCVLGIRKKTTYEVKSHS